jgi:8-oxo-dGTP pyrophosphatase MutT (NUDIX family)
MGEGYEAAATRELHEELGIRAERLELLYDYLWETEVETERVKTYLLVHDGPFHIQQEEIEEARRWRPEEIEANLGQGVFTPNFEEEWRRYKGR